MLSSCVSEGGRMRHKVLLSLALVVLLASAARADVTMTIGNVVADTGSMNGYIPVSVGNSTFAGFGLTLTYDNSVFEVVPGWMDLRDRTVSETIALTRLS